MKAMLATVPVVMALAGSASAAVLYTPALLTDDNQTYVRCVISNIATKDLTVKVEVLDGSGMVTADSGEFTLASGATASNVFGFNGVNICKFTVKSKKKVRAHACISDFATNTCDMQADAK